MVGTVPGDEATQPVHLHFTKTHKRFHLMRVASQKLVHLHKCVNVVVRNDLHQILLRSSWPPKVPVENVPAIVVTMNAYVFGKRHKLLGNKPSCHVGQPALRLTLVVYSIFIGPAE